MTPYWLPELRHHTFNSACCVGSSSLTQSCVKQVTIVFTLGWSRDKKQSKGPDLTGTGEGSLVPGQLQTPGRAVLLPCPGCLF